MIDCIVHVHRRYYLSCDQFAELRAHSQEQCNICGMRERYMSPGLYIDHDHAIGDWAVRGLLCPRCNTSIEVPGRLAGPEVDEYLANPWHLRAGLHVPAARKVRQMALPTRMSTNSDRLACEAQLEEIGGRFMDMRGPGRGLDLATREFAKKHLHPVIYQAKGQGLSVRDVARRTGYTPEHVYEIWRVAEYEARRRSA